MIGGFSNGIIRIYDADKKTKMVEIAAHARTIFALDVATEAGLVSAYLITLCTMCYISVLYQNH